MTDQATAVGHTAGPWKATLREEPAYVWYITSTGQYEKEVAWMDGRSALWVFNNLHSVTKDPVQFIRFAEAAASDCRKAYAKAEGADR